MALRTLRCVFAADRGGLVLEAACNGYVDTIDTATGQEAHWCLVSVQVPRAEFEPMDLARVDPMDCLAYLHAKVSKTPEKYQPVQPIIDYPWDDLHYAEELDAAAGLDSVQNLLDLDGYEFEQLLVKLCQEIPEFDEVRRTRSRADGGIDLVAVNKTPFVGGRVAIQAKRYAPHNKVDIAAVTEMRRTLRRRTPPMAAPPPPSPRVQHHRPVAPQASIQKASRTGHRSIATTDPGLPSTDAPWAATCRTRSSAGHRRLQECAIRSRQAPMSRHWPARSYFFGVTAMREAEPQEAGSARLMRSRRRWTGRRTRMPRSSASRGGTLGTTRTAFSRTRC